MSTIKTKTSLLLLGDCLDVLKTIEENTFDSLVTDPPAGISFMGKEWDGDKGGREGWVKWMTEVMRETLRVMKPGAHGLVWAIPRTSHWTATSLELAGFEIRDVVTHLFGNGFPKSLDVSKAIDKSAGAERVVTRAGVMKAPEFSGKFDQGSSKLRIRRDLPSTNLAKQWKGWGTALKPASEHWILIRKPLSEKTVAKNVERWGTGGINIDACRIGTDRIDGRFPANLILSHHDGCEENKCVFLCPVSQLDKQSRPFGDKPSGASRFFYVSKASKKDRGEENTHPTVKASKLMEYLITLITTPSGTVLDPFMGSGSTGVAAKRLGFQFYGIEKEQNYFEIATKRIEDAEAAQIELTPALIGANHE